MSKSFLGPGNSYEEIDSPLSSSTPDPDREGLCADRKGERLVGWLVGVLWHINPSELSNAKSCLYM